MSLTLYHGEPNGPCLTVLAALFAKQVPADLRYIDLARGERHALPCAQEPLVAMSIEARLAEREWLMGDYSIADLESFAWLAGMVPLVPEAFAGRPRTKDWLARVKASAAVAKALSVARTAEPAASWSVGPEINRWG